MTITDISAASVRNPATGAVLAAIPRASVEEAHDAVEHAQHAPAPPASSDEGRSNAAVVET